LLAVAEQMFALMLRNLAKDDFVFVDPGSADSVSAAGCVLASPTYPDPPVPVGQAGPQDYLFNWIRDAAIAAMELAASAAPLSVAERTQRLGDYVGFAAICQANAPNDGHWDDFARACYTVEGLPRVWGNQGDGPALQTLAVLQAFPFLVDMASQNTALKLVAANVQFLLTAYQKPTVSLWEEEYGNSFFARSVQLRCFQAVQSNTINFAVPAEVDTAVGWLQNALPRHWSASQGCYLTFEPPWSPDPKNFHDPYDPNIDVVLAALYGSIPVADGVHPFLDPKLLASASAVRAVWTESGSPYPINANDAKLRLGPLLGRYPSDYYDGDTNDPKTPGHPWSLCTSAFAELYFRVASAITSTNTVPSDPVATEFLKQVQMTHTNTAVEVASALRAAGDSMLRSLIFHSDNLQLSEQFDRDNGFERSLANLTWSYASFLSAVRAWPM
jgi:glucoamylase